jgi:hypothetical protein
MNIEEITGTKLTSVADLIDLEESLRHQSLTEHQHQWAFRGQPQEFGNLIPSFQRQFTKPSAGAAETIEFRLIAAFREHYALLNDRSPDMPAPGSIGSGRDLRCLSVMQHYEIPTRLLDWTSNFWTAVYFACAGDPAANAELWHYDRRMFHKQREENPGLDSLLDSSNHQLLEPVVLGTRGVAQILELDPRLTPRMRTQDAHHTVSTAPFSDHVHLLYKLQKSAFPAVANPRWFLKHTIASGCKPKALQYLAEHKHITASSIFPDVVGLGRFLRWQLESLRTMML